MPCHSEEAHQRWAHIYMGVLEAGSIALQDRVFHLREQVDYLACSPQRTAVVITQFGNHPHRWHRAYGVRCLSTHKDLPTAQRTYNHRGIPSS